MYAQLGDIVYEGLAGFQVFDQSKEGNYAEHGHIYGKPGSQHLGDALDTVSLQIRLNKFFTDPDLEINKLDEHKKKGTILTMIMGDGRIIGDFFIKSYTISTKQMLDGVTILAEVSLDLKEYFTPDKEAAAKTDAVNNGFANSQNNPQVTTPTSEPGTPSMEASNSMVSVGATVGAVSTMGDTLNENSTILQNTCEQMKTKVVSAINDTQKIITLIDADATSELYAVTRDLSNSCATMVVNLGSLVTDISQLISDITGNPINVPAGIITVGQDITDALSNMEQIRMNASKMAAMAALKK